ncbi:hypothetical protein TNCT_309271 [Trichonephila clavata]|uniref:Uncharacterized protein n=1 Tax=Trichonephila clavata TaxID=2740835 RepID=A0A8X6LFQ7_TRICU|nr:hypothetical protein TNCT_309271 [Trichonephila clavata]
MFWRRTKNGNSIAEKFNDDTLQKILTTKIPHSKEGRKGVFTLPCYAISLENNQAFEMFLQEAAKRKFLKDLLNEELTGEILGVQKTTYTVLIYCISEKNSKAVRAVLEASKENGILKEILDQKMIKEKANDQKISYTLIDYANEQNCKEIVATLKEFEESLNIEVKSVSGNAETSCEDINVDCEDLEIHEPMLANSEEAQDILTKDDIDQIQSSRTTFTEIVKRDQTQSCSHSKSRKGSAENGKPLKHKRKLIKTDTESREKSTDNLTLESKATTQLHGDINKDSELIFETNKKAQNALTEEEPDIPSPTELYFDSKENSADEKSSKKAIQPIVASVVGAVLLVSCVALYIVKMPVVAAVVGIIGLACIGFALYNTINPNTKLEKVEEQSITAHPPLKII